jgi:hypothetical protein
MKDIAPMFVQPNRCLFLRIRRLAAGKEKVYAFLPITGNTREGFFRAIVQLCREKTMAESLVNPRVASKEPAIRRYDELN